MPTATLTFTLPEEAEDHQIALDGWKYRAALGALDERLRQFVKYGKESERRAFTAEAARGWLWDALKEQGVDGELH